MIQAADKQLQNALIMFPSVRRERESVCVCVCACVCVYVYVKERADLVGYMYYVKHSDSATTDG